MKPYDELLNQIPKEAWQYVEAEYEEDDDGNGSIQFYWDEDEHPELAPLSQLTEDQWEDFVIESLQRTIQESETNEVDQGSIEPSDRNDGESGELAGESDS
jgi:hypothetical protein